MKMKKTQLLEIIQKAVRANGGNERAQQRVVESVKRKLNEDIDTTSMPSGTRLAYKSLLQWVKDTDDEVTIRLFNKLIYMIESDYKKEADGNEYGKY